MANLVSPYLQALYDLQKIITEITKVPYVQPKIKFISQNSPIEATLTGVAETAAFVRDEITPWRREHAQKMADLEIKKKKLEIESDEIKKQRDLIALEKEKLELQQAQIDLVLNFVNKIASGLSDSQRIMYSIGLLKSLNIIVENPLEVLSITEQKNDPA